MKGYLLKQHSPLLLFVWYRPFPFPLYFCLCDIAHFLFLSTSVCVISPISFSSLLLFVWYRPFPFPLYFCLWYRPFPFPLYFCLCDIAYFLFLSTSVCVISPISFSSLLLFVSYRPFPFPLYFCLCDIAHFLSSDAKGTSTAISATFFYFVWLSSWTDRRQTAWRLASPPSLASLPPS